MDDKVTKGGSAAQGQAHQIENEMDIRKGPWTVDEDTILLNYITSHGEGRWNNVARCAGLNRSGKSCRLRWLNYLRPDLRRGNITLEEKILILDLHSRWGNRWSKIAQHMPGRTDNEIKNYWRTRVIKQAKQLKCDVNSKQFRDIVQHVWMPRLLERAHHASFQSLQVQKQVLDPNPSGTELVKPNHSSSSCASGASSDSSSFKFQVPSNSDHTDFSQLLGHVVSVHSVEKVSDLWPGFSNQMFEQGNGDGGDSLESLWNDENIWFLQQLLSDDLQM